ncbi:MAG: nucleoside triphosphate pyrophosphohydrolase [Bacteroidota bacterium]
MKRAKTDDQFAKFMGIVRRLRKECPWDREQTHQSIRHSLLEEAYEVLEAIDRKNLSDLKDELGDLLLHIALHSVMAQERKAFTMDDVLRSVSAKLVRRHPHVFGSISVRSSGEVKANWEKLKLKEGRTSVLEGVPRKLPALLKARRLQEKASKVGFDWKRKKDVWKKVEEELAEFRSAERNHSKRAMEEEFGDVLFSLVNYSRFINIHPELALARTTQKFTTRFQRVERELTKRGIALAEAGLPLMDELWNRGKTKLR